MLTKVLVIDDDIETIKLVEAVLKRQAFEVLTAHSGRAGIEAARHLEPEIVILDLMMPGVDGWEVCRTIRTFSQVPILVMSAVTDSARVMRALDEGANDYLIKPVPPGVIIARLNKLIQKF